MKEFFDRVFAQPFGDFLERVSEFLPSLITCLVLIVTGMVIAWVFKVVVVWVLRLLKIDPLSERAAVTQVIQRGGIKDPLSKLIGRLVYWLVLISFIVMGLEALQVPAVEELFTRFFLYLPNLIVAAALIIFGYIIGSFLGRAALIASVNAGIPVSGLVGRLVKYIVFVLAVTMALELLGIGKDTVLIAFSLVFGGIVLALAIAFGLGGKELARGYLERRFKHDEEKDEFRHI